MTRIKVPLTTKDRHVLQAVIDLLRTEADALDAGPVQAMWRRRAARTQKVLAGRLNAQSAGDLDMAGVDLDALTDRERKSIERVWQQVGAVQEEARADHAGKGCGSTWERFSLGSTLHGITGALHGAFPREPEWQDGEPSSAPVTIPAVYVAEFHKWATSYRETYADIAEHGGVVGAGHARRRWAHDVVLDQLDAAPDALADVTVMVPVGDDHAGSFLIWMLDSGFYDDAVGDIADLFRSHDAAEREKGRTVLDGYLAVVDQLEAIAA